jgi:REP element-mobilizing transposase RayT
MYVIDGHIIFVNYKVTKFGYFLVHNFIPRCIKFNIFSYIFQNTSSNIVHLLLTCNKTNTSSNIVHLLLTCNETNTSSNIVHLLLTCNKTNTSSNIVHLLLTCNKTNYTLPCAFGPVYIP